MPAEDNTAPQINDGDNDSNYQQYLRDFEQTKSKLAERGRQTGMPTGYQEWLIKNNDEAPEQLSTDRGGGNTKPAKLKSVSGEGIRKTGDSSASLKVKFTTDEPSPPPPPIRFPGERRITIGQHDPNYKKYLNKKAAREEEALENDEELEPPLNYDDWMDEEQAALADEGYQKYLADHTVKAEQAKTEGKNIGEPKSHEDYLDEQAGMEDADYQKYLDNQEAARTQADAQGLDLGEPEEPLSYKDWRDEQAGKEDNDYQNYKKNLKPEESTKPYKNWKKEQEEIKNEPVETEQPSAENQAKEQAEKKAEEQPGEGEQKPTEEAEKPTTEPPELPEEETAAEEEPEKTPEAAQPPELSYEDEQARAGVEMQQPSEQGGAQTPEQKKEQEKKQQETGAEPSKVDEKGALESTEAATQISSNAQEMRRKALEEVATKSIAAGVKAANAIPVVGPIIKGLAWVVKILRDSGLGEPLAHLIVCWFLLTAVFLGLFNLILPIIGSALAYIAAILAIPIVGIFYFFDIEIPFLGIITAKIGGPGFRPTAKNFLRLITDGVAQSAAPNTPGTGGNKPGGTE